MRAWDGNDSYRPGDNYVLCDVCGSKLHASQTSSRWDGLQVCRKDWEARHPQDYVRGRRDKQAPEVVRSEPADRFVNPGDIKASDL